MHPSAAIRLSIAIGAVAAIVIAAGAPPAMAAGAGTAASCSGGRWDVRTLSDRGARRVASRPVSTTVQALRGLRRPGRARYRGRVRGIETTTYRVEARLVSMRLAPPGEIVVMVADPRRAGSTIEVRFPDPNCGKRRSVQRTAVSKARTALIAACGRAGRNPVGLSGSATITGVGYLGSRRGKRGAKGIALEPVLRFEGSGCARPVGAKGSPGQPASVAPGDGSSTGPISSSDCTIEMSGGSIEAMANSHRDVVICLHEGDYKEPGDSLIVVRNRRVRIQAAPGEHPVVCGHIVIRGSDSSVANDVGEDPHCATWFNELSPYNKVASEYGQPLPIPGSWLADFGDGALQLSRSWEHGKAMFRAGPSDPVTARFRIAHLSQCFDDPVGCARWQPTDPDHRVADNTSAAPEAIPIPAGVRCPGLPLIDNQHDRALVVIAADGKTAWEFWHCTHAATALEPWYEAAVATRWRIDPDDPSLAAAGYQNLGLGTTGSQSARASGTPLLTTTITPSEALFGIHHPIGLTVRAITTGYINPPASHTDVCDGCSHLKYGMLFVLNPQYVLPPGATPSQVNIVTALKEYGAYVVDRGPVFELDGSPNEPTDPQMSDQLWAQAADGNLAGLNIRPGDLLYVPTPGSPPALP